MVGGLVYVYMRPAPLCQDNSPVAGNADMMSIVDRIVPCPPTLSPSITDVDTNYNHHQFAITSFSSCSLPVPAAYYWSRQITCTVIYRLWLWPRLL